MNTLISARKNSRAIPEQLLEPLVKKGIITGFKSLINPFSLDLIPVIMIIHAPIDSLMNTLDLLAVYPFTNSLFQCSNQSLLVELFFPSIKSLEVLIRVLSLMNVSINYFFISSYLKTESFLS